MNLQMRKVSITWMRKGKYANGQIIEFEKYSQGQEKRIGVSANLRISKAFTRVRSKSAHQQIRELASN